MDMLENLRRIAAQVGFHETGTVDIHSLEYVPEVRRICEKNSCGGYNKSWACPPAVGTLEECRARCEKYEHMLIFTGKYQLEDSFDYEGMVAGSRAFSAAVDRFHEEIRGFLDDYMLLANEGCDRCKKCTWPDAPCRFPEKFHQSLEAYGFIVSRLAMKAGVKYNNGPNTVTYFGAVLYNE